MHGYGSDERNNANDFQLAISILLQFHMYIFNLVQKKVYASYAYRKDRRFNILRVST